jgi:hypothetical protein
MLRCIGGLLVTWFALSNWDVVAPETGEAERERVCVCVCSGSRGSESLIDLQADMLMVVMEVVFARMSTEHFFVLSLDRNVGALNISKGCDALQPRRVMNAIWGQLVVLFTRGPEVA